MFVDDKILRSMVMDTPWFPGVPLQTNEVYSHAGGIHAFKTIEQAKNEYGWWGFGKRRVVLGSISMWGEVIEHTGGYRAEYAAVRSINKVLGSDLLSRCLFWRPSEKETLRKKYGVNALND